MGAPRHVITCLKNAQRSRELAGLIATDATSAFTTSKAQTILCRPLGVVMTLDLIVVVTVHCRKGAALKLSLSSFVVVKALNLIVVIAAFVSKALE